MKKRFMSMILAVMMTVASISQSSVAFGSETSEDSTTNREGISEQGNLVGEWRFDSLTGTTAPDTLGQHDGVLQGNATLTDGRKGKGLLLKKQNSAFVKIPNILNPGTSSFTLSAWVKPNGTNNSILSQEDKNGTGRNWLGINSSGKFYSLLGGTEIVIPTNVDMGAWYHVGVTYDYLAKNLSFYINGELVTQRTTTITPTDGDYRVGSFKGSGGYWDGIIDELKLFNQTLSASDMSDMMDPLLRLNGESLMTVYLGDSYNEPGATAFSLVDGDLTSSIVTNGVVDTGNQGTYTITYTVTDSQGFKVSKTRTVKVVPEQDARGRVLIPQSKLNVSASSEKPGNEISKAFDGDPATKWIAAAADRQTITIGLGDTYTISKMDYLADITDIANRIVAYKLYVSTDGSNYTEIVPEGNFQKPSHFIRNALGVADEKVFFFFAPVKAKFVKLEVLTTNASSLPVIGEMNVYRDTREPEGKGEPIPASELYVNPRLSLASQVLIEKGLQIQTWMPSDGYGREVPTASEFYGMNLTGTTYYDPPLYNSYLQDQLPGAQWNLAKAPTGTNSMTGNPQNRDHFLTPEQIANIDNAVSFNFGDEGEYSIKQEEYFGNWFELSKELYPRVLVHSNQYYNQWSQQQLKSFLENANPDLLTFDYYIWDTQGLVKDYNSTKTILDLANYQRKLALLGQDGTGQKPIGFGQYLGSYKIGIQQFSSGWYEMTESQKYAVTNLSLAMGMKWLNLFRFEFDHLYAFLFDEYGYPTHHYDEYAEIFKQAQNWGPHLVRLNNIDVRVKPGQYMSNGSVVNNTSPSGWQLGEFTSNSNPEYHLTDISSVNTGTQNDGLKGDVAVGYFKALPGYDTTDFFTATDPKYFMVVNGLVTGNGLRPEMQHGSLEDTSQEITLTFSSPTADLKKVNKHTGEVESVQLTSIGNDKYTIKLDLGGGEAELFYWEENKKSSALSANADLLTLEVKEAEVPFDFDANTLEYTAAVSTNSATVNVFSVEANAKVTVNGNEPNSKGDVVVNLTNGENQIEVVVISEDGTAKKTYQLHITTEGSEPVKENQVTLKSPAQVQMGESFDVLLGLKQVSVPVQAHDITISYDAEKFEFKSAESLLENVSIVEAGETDGKVHLLIASLGTEHAISTNEPFIKMTLVAKATSEQTTGDIAVTQAILSDREGIETNAALAAVKITINSIDAGGITGDVNNDGKISIGDLAIVASHYGKNEQSPDWNKVKHADINKDGKIDIADLTAIAILL